MGKIQYSALKPASKMDDSWPTTIQFVACSAGVNHFSSPFIASKKLQLLSEAFKLIQSMRIEAIQI